MEAVRNIKNVVFLKMTKHFRNCFCFTTLVILAVGFLIWCLYQIDLTKKEIESLDFSSYLKFKRQQSETEQFEFEVKSPRLFLSL